MGPSHLVDGGSPPTFTACSNRCFLISDSRVKMDEIRLFYPRNLDRAPFIRPMAGECTAYRAKFGAHKTVIPSELEAHKRVTARSWPWRLQHWNPDPQTRTLNSKPENRIHIPGVKSVPRIIPDPTTRFQLLRRNVKWFRDGLVFEAHRLLYHSVLGSRVMMMKKKSDCSTLKDSVRRLFLNHNKKHNT